MSRQRGATRLRLAVRVGHVVAALSRMCGFGGGETIAGRVILALAPDALERLAERRRIVLVSGTNGKTTVTALLARLLEECGGGPVSTSGSGANLPSGIATALSAQQTGVFCVLECDELHLARMAELLRPELILLLNLSRDQLHRTGGVYQTAERLRRDLAATTAMLLIDAGDPFLAYVASGRARVRRVSFGGRVHPDASACPDCGSILEWSADGFECWCGLGSQPPDARWGSELLVEQRNAAMACEAAGVLIGALPREVVSDTVAHPPDRGIVSTIRGRSAQCFLGKNQASWRRCLEKLTAEHVVLVLNDNGADGRDPSWIWDVDHSLLAGRRVVCTGDRRLDLAYRLCIQGLRPQVAKDVSSAVLLLGEEPVQIIATMTAFHALGRTAEVEP